MSKYLLYHTYIWDRAIQQKYSENHKLKAYIQFKFPNDHIQN